LILICILIFLPQDVLLPVQPTQHDTADRAHRRLGPDGQIVHLRAGSRLREVGVRELNLACRQPAPFVPGA
jgi:hypothetical protein